MEVVSEHTTAIDTALEALASEGIDFTACEQSEPEAQTQTHGGITYEVGPEGVFATFKLKSKKVIKARVCDELRVLAKTRDGASASWGLLLAWKDADGVEHQQAFAADALIPPASGILGELSLGGLHIDGDGIKGHLLGYLRAWHVGERVKCVDVLGWHGTVYCTAHETIGEGGGKTVFQGSAALTSGYSQRNTAEEWRDNVAALAAGNSRLVFALSCAFAGPLLHLAGVEAGGFHYVGASSSGKTTALKLAASVWGQPNRFTRPWRATANGLEGLAAEHNDSILCLDELSQCDPKQAGEAAYMLANGQGKARASRSGAARESAAWRLLFLSSGEVKLSAHMEGIGKKANAGQELRLANIPMDAGAGLGGFEQLHDIETPGAFAQRVATVCESSHGAVGLAWLRRLTADLAVVPAMVAKGVNDFVAEAVLSGASGQAGRVARRFGVVAAAGELATHYGLTGWDEGEAADAALCCFRAWLEGFGTGSHEDVATCEQVRLFFEQHGSARFQHKDASSDHVPNRAGFWQDGRNGSRQWLIPVATFKAEVLKGRDLKQGCKALEAAGMLIRGNDGRLTHKVRLPEMGNTRVYVLSIAEVEA